MAVVNFLHHENPSTWGGVDPQPNTPIKADKDTLEFVQNSKNIIDLDFEENEMNNATLVLTSSELMNILKMKFWAAEFKRDRNSLGDDERSGRTNTATTDKNIAKAHQNGARRPTN
ncbi:hypothetical protein TNCV_3477191 [Trichonephila clavipes]|nr:hypothetical protein TNCV_3477191 [Trichonephila clavipes]